MEELKYSYITNYISKKLQKGFLYNDSYILEKMEKCPLVVRNGSFVNKGDVLFSMTFNDTTIDVASPFSGYIEINSRWYRDGLNADIVFASFFEYEYEVYFKCRISLDKITNSKRVIWNRWDSAIYIADPWSFNSSELELNLKSNLPCLHFRYKNFHLKVNDRVYFIDADNNPIIDFVVVKKEHKYGDCQREVDFVLLNQDIISLKQCKVSKILIKFANDDKPIELSEFQCNKYYTINRLKKLIDYNLSNYEEYFENCKRAPGYRLFQLYVEAYCSLLDKEGYTYQDDSLSHRELEYDYCYVYLMHDKRNGYHKIGMSNKPDVREKTLQSEVPAVQMVCSKRYPSRKIAKAIEAALHNAYAEQRVRGEWFNLSLIDIQMLKETLS